MGNRESSSNVKAVVLPSHNITSGVNVEEQSFAWTIENFHVMRCDKSMIDSHKISIPVGGNIGSPPTNWTVQLQEKRIDDNQRWIGVQFRPEDGPFKKYLEIGCQIKSKEGKLLKSEFEPLAITRTRAGITSLTIDKFIDQLDVDFCPGYSIVIMMTFRICTPSQPGSSLEAVIRKFQDKFAEQLRKDFAGLLGNPLPGTDSRIKIVSNDQVEFSMLREILAVRSVFFAAMLNADMIEANSGVIHLPDISSSALRVLLHFICTGELLPEWSETEVIIELTNAAAQYQLEDLLQFLDMAVGKVCQGGNVEALLVLARQLSLKQAEEELMDFVRKEGVGAPDKLVEICCWDSDEGIDENEELN